MADELRTVDSFSAFTGTRLTSINTGGDAKLVAVNSNYIQGLIDEYGGDKCITVDETVSALPTTQFVTVFTKSGDTYDVSLYPITGTSITSAFTESFKSEAFVVILPPTITSVETSAFASATKMQYINLEHIRSLGNYAFSGTSSLIEVNCSSMYYRPGMFVFANSGVKRVLSFGTVNMMGGYGFDSCRKLETLTIASTQFYQNEFRYCSALKTITFQRLPFNFNQGNVFLGTTAVETINMPNIDGWWSCTFKTGGYSNPHGVINSGFAKLYVNGVRVTGTTNPSTVTSVGEGQFFGLYIEEITLTNSITSIGRYAFAKNTGLQKIHIPSSVTSYGNGIFRHSNALSSVTIMNSVGITSTQLIEDANEFFGSGTGTLYINGNYTQKIDGNYRDFRFKTIHIGGNFSTSGDYTYWPFHETYTQIIKIDGNIASNAQLQKVNNALLFFECDGQITVERSNGILLEPTNSIIIHLGYNGICCPVSYLTTAAIINSKVTTIYVGDGSSQSADQAVKNQYLADSGWAQYSSKIDLWYNYNGEYKD